MPYGRDGVYLVVLVEFSGRHSALVVARGDKTIFAPRATVSTVIAGNVLSCRSWTGGAGIADLCRSSPPYLEMVGGDRLSLPNYLHYLGPGLAAVVLVDFCSNCFCVHTVNTIRSCVL